MNSIQTLLHLVRFTRSFDLHDADVKKEFLVEKESRSTFQDFFGRGLQKP